MASRFKPGDCVRLRDGRIGRVRGRLKDGYRIRVRRRTSQTHEFVMPSNGEQSDYEGFITRPMPWATVVQKFERLTRNCADASQRRQIVDAVANLESIPISELTRLLAGIQPPPAPLAEPPSVPMEMRV